ncbi:LysR family transcriptional regulator [Azotosporobacter soli]|uniref:LysR family transcriptional regulator n=1 Tax=Azotosporobacter soli TaxID=3055040 RepID=UPI0031FF1E3D
MDLRKLKYFLAVANEGQITRAASRLNMAQPPLSQQLRLLEEELGVRLFHRGSRSIDLTEAGQLLKERAEQVFELLDVTTKNLKDIHHGDSGALTIGTAASFGVTVLMDHIKTFHRLHPRISYQLWEGDTIRILELLESRVIEIGFVRSPVNDAQYESLPLGTDSLLAAIHEDFLPLLPNSSEPLTWHDLNSLPIATHRRLEALITPPCLKHGFEPQIRCLVDDVRSLLVWAEYGIAIAIIPGSAKDLAPTSKIHYRPLLEPQIELSQRIVWKKDHYLSAATRLFLESIQGGQ